MDPTSSLAGSPGGPLRDIPLERVNQQREPSGHHSSVHSECRDSTVHEKISQFNNLATQSKQLERKTADAALKRAMLGREEAESEMRRYRDEFRGMRKQIDEGRDRERRVGERLEAVMENYGRAKETYAHTQALWEKEIRRARKETFKTQSTIVKLQEELKASRANLKLAEEAVEREKERSRVREQEAFAARYQLVGVQEQLAEALERAKVLEQERDAYKTLAKNEEVARIAAEGRLPLPRESGEGEGDDEFASPARKAGPGRIVSISAADIVSSAASEAEIEELTRQVAWERRRAERAQELVEFLQAECHLRCCPCAKEQPKPVMQQRSSAVSSRRKLRDTVEIADPSDLVILREEPEETEASAPEELTPRPLRSVAVPVPTAAEEPEEVKVKLEPSAPRRSTIFCPREGIFRTISQQEAEAMEDVPEENAAVEPPSPDDVQTNPRMFARTPSVDPPAFALLAQERTSLLSLLNAPHSEPVPLPRGFIVPVTPDVPAAAAEPDANDTPSQDPRPHTSAAFYTVTTTTTVPLRETTARPASVLAGGPLRTPSAASNRSSNSSSGGSGASFDASNPAMTPTMTREQALAQIRERRGRARSAAQGAPTPKRRIAEGAKKRDVSAPMSRAKGLR